MPNYVIHKDFDGSISERSEILYVIQVADLIAVYDAIFGEDSWNRLPSEEKNIQKNVAFRFIGRLDSSSYNWMDALKDSILESKEAPDTFDEKYFEEDVQDNL